MIADLISRRYNARLPLIVTSNYPLDAEPGGTETTYSGSRMQPVLAEYIGERAASRLREMCRTVELWELSDYRRQRQQ